MVLDCVYWLERLALTVRQEEKLQVAENTCTDRETGGEATGSREHLH